MAPVGVSPVSVVDLVRLLHQHVHERRLAMVQVPHERHVADQRGVARQAH